MSTQVQLSIIRLPELLRLTGLSRPTIYRRMNAGTFPKQIMLGERAVGWRAHEVNHWLESLVSRGE
ncbi:helix-turn-helix transcriptional regulator [Vibrio tasmaniensis]|uniref:helix-turn-helix transcriptional regulator n=1 Tax=Vibrio tasmaniensis TaxID=212663 RepID=UPI00107F0123|nr:AlpA family transcriptional regulator [Vibrio tasmaniensis]